MFKRSTSFLWGILLLPLAMAAAINLPSLLLSLNSRAEFLFCVILGALLYAILETLFNLPMRTYVFGHELTHALASIFMGGKVHSFDVAKDGGSVALSNTNFIISLAPYCAPIYTIITLIVFYVLKFWYPVENYRMILLGLVGFTLAFHGSLTFYAIRQKQPDIEKTGVFFSLVFIIFANVLFVVLLSKVLFWNAVSLRHYALDTVRTQVHIWKWIFQKTVMLCRWVYARYAKPVA